VQMNRGRDGYGDGKDSRPARAQAPPHGRAETQQRERSLSPFSKRLAMTRAMQQGR
jgi:hypothetical protein